MQSIAGDQAGLGPRGGRGAALVLAVTLAILPLAGIEAQNSKFQFDGSGELIAQSGEAAGAPRILSQPQMQTVIPGQSASFSVLLADTRGVTYQWLFNGGTFAGATADSLLLLNVSTNNEGLYSVIVSNASGSITSSPANLYIDSDGDGLPDSWEIAHFGNLNQTATGDYDGDGVSNLQEFQDGTDPTNAASVLYRVTVFNDGGTVLVSPNQTAFTKGQILTLTAIASNGSPFHAWTGDITTRSNSITFPVNTNMNLFARFLPFTLTWTNPANGDWNVASNWTPNLVPGTNESVLIANGTTVTENSNVDLVDFTLGVGNIQAGLTGAGRVTIAGTGIWNAGSMNGSGITVVLPGASLQIANGVQLGRTLENAGSLNWLGGSFLLNGGVITNDTGTQFTVQNPGSLIYAGGSPRFDNAGTFVTAANGTTALAAVAFNNYGAVATLPGATFSLSGGGVQAGTILVPSGTTVIFSGGTFTSTSDLMLTGAGTWLFTGGSATLAGTINVTGSNAFTGGAVDFTGNYTYTGNLLISGASVSFDGTGNVSPLILTLAGPATLGGAQTVTVGSAMTWSGGTMAGTGKTVIPASATLTISNASFLNLNTRTLDNAGTILWPGGAALSLVGGVITNEPGALFQVQGPQSISFGGGLPRFDNAGSFRVTGGGVTAFGGVPFNNFNVVDLQAGTLFLNGGGIHTGTMTVPANTALELSGTFGSSGSSSITGAGQLIVSGGSATLAGAVNLGGSNIFNSGSVEFTGNYVCTNNTLVIAGGTVSFDGTGVVSPAVLNLNSSGTLGGAQTVTVGSAMTWVGGAMAGTGKTVIPASATLTISNGSFITLNTRTLDNAGTILWPGGAGLSLVGGVITNEPGALFQVRGPQSLNYGGGSSRFDNAGGLNVAGSGTVDFGGIPLNNYNTVSVSSGTTLELAGGGVQAGTMTVGTGALLNLAGGNFSSMGSPSITGQGSLLVNGGGTTLGGTINLGGSNSFLAGTIDFTGNYICTNNVMVISGGAASFDGTGTVAPATLNLGPGGQLGGAQTVRVTGAMNWTGGSMNGSGTTVVASNAALTINNPGSFISLSGRTLDNAGTVQWLGGNSMSLNGAIITNEAGAVFQVQGPQSLNYGGGSSRFDNAGTFRKSVSAGTATVGVQLNNYGTMDLQCGAINASGGYTCASNSILNCALWGTVPGATFCQLQASGAVNVKGSLNVYLTNYYVPKTNDAFAVLTATSVNGAFASFGYPTNNLAMSLTSGPASEIVRVTGVSLPQTNFVPAPPGMISWWRGENNANDSVGTNNGILTNGVAYAAGEVGQSFQFDGFSGAVSIPDSASLRPASVTLEAWVKIFSTNGIQLVFAKPLGTNTLDSYGLALQNGVPLAAICDSGGFGAFLSDSSVMSLGQWHHLAFTFDAATGLQALYTDGAMVASGGAGKSMNFDDHPLLLGADNDNTVPDNFLNGQIDEASIYNRALTANEIGSIYNVGVGGKQAVSAPVLYMELITPATARIYWSTNYTKHHLEYNAVPNTTNWAASGLTPVVVGTNFVVTNSLSSIRRFYRLSSVPAPYNPPPPSLGIQMASPGFVRLLWPVEDDRPFVLQSVTNLDSTNWLPVLPSPSTMGPNNVVTNSLNGPQRFYRLSNR